MGEIRVRVPRLRCIAGRYFWRPSSTLRAKGFRSVALGADPVEAAKKAEKLNARVAQQRRMAKGSGIVPESVGEMIRIYVADPRYTDKSDNTKRTYKTVLNEIERKVGDEPIAAVTRRHLRAAYRSISTERGVPMAKLHIVVWRLLLEVAIDEGLRTDNPARGMKMARGRRRTQKWNSEQIEHFCATAAALERPSVALGFRLAYDLAQRGCDVLRLTWHQYRDGAMFIAQSKTQQPVGVPVSAETRALLDGMRRTGVHIVISERTGQPYKDQAWRDAFTTVRMKAGLPENLQFRDLRRTALSEAGDGGATDDELRALGGHRSRETVGIYVVPSTTMAGNAQAKRERGRNRSGKLPQERP